MRRVLMCESALERVREETIAEYACWSRDDDLGYRDGH